MKITDDAKPTGIELKVVYAPFDQAKEELENNGYKIISLEENARLRMQQGKDAYFSRNGNRTREGVLYLPDKRILLTKNSPIMINAKEAINAYRRRNEYFWTYEQVEEALKDSVKLSGESIATNGFKENEITSYAFGDAAEDYGLFLKEAGIKEMPIRLANTSDKIFARQVWFASLDFRSELNGSGGSLASAHGLCGIKMVTNEAGFAKTKRFSNNLFQYSLDSSDACR